MSTTTHHETTINVPEGLPTVEIIREFDGPDPLRRESPQPMRI